MKCGPTHHHACDCLEELFAQILAKGERLEAECLRMRDRIERLRGALKTASGRFFEADDLQSADDCLEWAGDMEPQIMGSNV